MSLGPAQDVPVLAGGLAPAHEGHLAAGLLSRQESRRSRRFIFILAPAVIAPPALRLVSPGRESNLVPFSILEALLRIKNRSNDGKES